MVQDYDSDMDLRDFIRKFSEAEGASELPEDNEALSDILMDNLQYGINDPDGRTALVYRLMWQWQTYGKRLWNMRTRARRYQKRTAARAVVRA